jgi:hypothetical protein
MRVMTIREAVIFLNAPAPDGLGMKTTHAWVRWMAEPTADGRRRLPFFKAPGGGKTTKLLTTDEALREHFKRLADAAIAGIHGAA